MMMQRTLILLLVTMLATPIKGWSQELLVIVNQQNPLEQISRQQLTDLFMGRAPYFPSGDPVVKLDAPGDSPLRRQFYQALVGMSEPEVNAYWARLMFSGRATPPMQVSSEQDILKLVENNPNAIGYITDGELNDEVKTIFVVPVD